MNLNHVTILSLDLTKSIPFYKQLGLIVHSDNNYARFECPNGGSTFSIHRVEQLPKGQGIWIYFECENLDNHVSKLENSGIEFEEYPNDKRWLWREARLKDPDNNQIILFNAGENRKNPPWRIQ